VVDDLETAIAAGAVTALRRRSARQTDLARLGTVESDKTPGVFIRTGEAAARRSPGERVGSAGPGNGGRAMREAMGRKTIATPQSRGAGQAKERTMPKKPSEMTPEPHGEEQVVAHCAQKRGRGREPGFHMSEEHRTKIKNSRLLKVLIDHVEGRAEISQSRVTAALGLLKKVLPDLQSVTVAGDSENPLVNEIHRIERIVVYPKEGR